MTLRFTSALHLLQSSSTAWYLAAKIPTHITNITNSQEFLRSCLIPKKLYTPCRNKTQFWLVCKWLCNGSLWEKFFNCAFDRKFWLNFEKCLIDYHYKTIHGTECSSCRGWNSEFLSSQRMPIGQFVVLLHDALINYWRLRLYPWWSLHLLRYC